LVWADFYRNQQSIPKIVKDKIGYSGEKKNVIYSSELVFKIDRVEAPELFIGHGELVEGRVLRFYLR